MFPCLGDRQHPRLWLNMEPELWADVTGTILWLSRQGHTLQKHLPSHSSLLFPIPSQAVSSHPASQVRGTHKNPLDTEPVKAAPGCSVGSSGADNHRLCYHVGWCFLISKSGQCLGKLYLPKTQALQKIKIPLKAWEHSYLSEEVSCFLLLHVVRKGILYPSSFMFFFSFILIP